MAKKTADYHKRYWLIQAPLGLILIGAGMSLAIEVGTWKAAGATTPTWVLWGTFALVLFNSGLCFFGDSILHRIRYERLME